MLEGASIGIGDAIADPLTYKDIQDTIKKAKVRTMFQIFTLLVTETKLKLRF